MANMDVQFLPPVFFKAAEVSDYKTLKEYEVCKSVFNVIGQDSLLGCQRIRGLWRIYVKTIDQRIKLLANKITIRNQLINLYKDNPFIAGLDSPDQQVIRLTFIEIPLSKGNRGVEQFILDHNLDKTSAIQYGKIRDPDTKVLTDILSGSRYVFVKPFGKDLPRNIRINDSPAKLYYDDQVVPQIPMLCTNCFATTHFKSRCTNVKKCVKCKQPDHSTNGTECEATLVHPNANVLPFQGENDILSNFYSCTINMHGLVGNSSEHIYQFVHAVRSGDPTITEKMRNAPNAPLAKRYSREIPYSETWEKDKVQVMKEILCEKAKQVPEFKAKLLDSKPLNMVEAVPGDYFWSCGLNKQDTLYTRKRNWPGKNTLGSLLMDLRAELDQNGKSKKKKKKKSKDKQESNSSDDGSTGEE